MDTESSTSETRDDDNARSTQPSSRILSRVISAPDPVRPGFPRSAEHLKSPSSIRKLQPGRESDEILTQWHSTGSAHSDNFAERPEKRPRLDHKLDTRFGKSFRRAFPLDTSPPGTGPRPHYLASTTSPRSSDISEHDHASRSPCFNCWGSESLVNNIITSLMDLQLQISKALPGTPQKIHEAVPDDVTKQGLKHSLEWTRSEIRAILQTVHGASATRPGLPSLTDVVPERDLVDLRRPSLPGPSPAVATHAHESRPLSLATDSGRSDELSRKSSDPTRDPYYSQEHPLSSLPTPDEMHRVQPLEQYPQSASSLPSAGSVFGHQSPTQQHRSYRTLPSPPSAQYPSPGFQGPPSFSSAAHTSHLQDLQHQISTKALALQTLQREHDQLLAAFSRSQIRCSTLDKKSQVSDYEINSLTEEKLRLQQQVESLETQVDELVKARDEVNKQSSADGAQWRQIMAMSSQLQMQGAEETRKFKADREGWESDRLALRQRIRELETGHLTTSTASGSMTLTDAADDPLNTTSLDVMRQEIVRLRQLCADMEKTLQDLAGGTEEIDNAINAMASIRQRIARKKAKDDGS